MGNMGQAINGIVIGRQAKRGASLLAVSVVMVTLAVLSLAMFRLVDSGSRTQNASLDKTNARYVAEAGMSLAVMKFSAGTAIEELAIGTEQNPAAFGSGDFWVEVDGAIGSNLYELTATGVENGVGAQLKVVLEEVTDNLHVWAAFGDEGLTMDSNAQVDSYDSSLGSYASQDTNGNGSSSYALTNGNVGSNHDVDVDGNVKIYGDMTPGPTGAYTAGSNVTLSGSAANATAEVEMPAVTVPSIASMGDLDLDGSVSGPFSSYIPSGSYHFEAVTVDGNNVTVIGPAVLVFDSFEIYSSSEFLADTTNGPVEVYVLDDFVMNSNTLIAPLDWDPAGFELKLLSDNVIDPMLTVDLDVVDLNSNAQMYGTLYAPSASIEINSNFELFGSLVARRVHLDSNSKIHFDEALLSSQGATERTFQTVAWLSVPYQP
jgi:Tfp pilus assembly protein PilX